MVDLMRFKQDAYQTIWTYGSHIAQYTFNDSGWFVLSAGVSNFGKRSSSVHILFYVVNDASSGITAPPSTPAPPAYDPNFRTTPMVAAGNTHTVGSRYDGTVWVLGRIV